MARRRNKKKPRKPPACTESSENDRLVSPQHVDARTNNGRSRGASEHVYGPECTNLDQGFSEESIRRQLGFGGESPARTNPSIHRTWDESGVDSWSYACGSYASLGGMAPSFSSGEWETWQNCVYQGSFLHGDVAGAQRDAEGMVFGTSSCGSVAKRGEGEPQWDINAYFAPLGTRHMQVVRRGNGRARDEWECDFCGLECFCWGLTDGVADEQAVSL
ncbi:hypothetical protein COCCADRAFT_84528 [Bipolaris zeicola 26-R-13]|uniref:Uncharacterized protein n=1 Tax=Cochliobolus carbonum (strain 26-R-13) TaxID=930089 RepID=W6YJV8_COCC2|nr:uncharacterized protein COCCADRAFT_84528 [Bipolaris zeicola 26-R-13]EUC37880.1 hypothetical protein COCCADRAFT_84528 [Bipolaris zeicola 26-R-13]